MGILKVSPNKKLGKENYIIAIGIDEYEIRKGVIPI